jgi:hypothetical protein
LAAWLRGCALGRFPTGEPKLDDKAALRLTGRAARLLPISAITDDETEAGGYRRPETALRMLERNISAVLAQSLEDNPKSLQGDDRDEAGWLRLGRVCALTGKKGSMSGLNLFVRALNPDWPVLNRSG